MLLFIKMIKIAILFFCIFFLSFKIDNFKLKVSVSLLNFIIK